MKGRIYGIYGDMEDKRRLIIRTLLEGKEVEEKVKEEIGRKSYVMVDTEHWMVREKYDNTRRIVGFYGKISFFNYTIVTVGKEMVSSREYEWEKDLKFLQKVLKWEVEEEVLRKILTR
jgi:hypothetical protein